MVLISLDEVWIRVMVIRRSGLLSMVGHDALRISDNELCSELQ